MPPGGPLLDVRGVTLQYKTRRHLITATYRVDFQVLQSDRYVILGHVFGFQMTHSELTCLVGAAAIEIAQIGVGITVT